MSAEVLLEPPAASYRTSKKLLRLLDEEAFMRELVLSNPRVPTPANRTTDLLAEYATQPHYKNYSFPEQARREFNGLIYTSNRYFPRSRPLPA